MLHLFTALNILQGFLTPTDDDHERGSVTIEHVMWAVAVLAIVGIVVAAIRAYVRTQAGLIS